MRRGEEKRRGGQGRQPSPRYLRTSCYIACFVSICFRAAKRFHMSEEGKEEQEEGGGRDGLKKQANGKSKERSRRSRRQYRDNWRG